MVKVTAQYPDMGEVMRFWETEPFEVDGIVYYPPNYRSYFPYQAMFVLKTDDEVLFVHDMEDG